MEPSSVSSSSITISSSTQYVSEVSCICSQNRAKILAHFALQLDELAIDLEMLDVALELLQN